MAFLFLPLFSLLLLLLPTTTTTLSPATLSNAAEVLSDSGYTAMSLTLPLISTPLLLPSLPSATLLTPSDTSFSLSPQPSLSLLSLHLLPLRYYPLLLRSLPFSSQLPSLLPLSPVSLTSSPSDDLFSFNNVSFLSSSPLFDDGTLIIYPLSRFLSLNFPLQQQKINILSPSPAISSRFICEGVSGASYGGAVVAMRAGGFGTMAAMLEMQLEGEEEGRRFITVFAPTDGAMRGYFGDLSREWAAEMVAVMRRHVVPCEVTWEEMVEGVVVKTFLEGFWVNVSRSSDGGGGVVINGEVTVDYPALYGGDRVVVHGVSGVLPVAKEEEGGSEDGGHRPASEWMYEF